MYIFQNNFLKTQQKYRKIKKNINKYNWYYKSFFFKINNLFFLTFFQSIDLRLYKIILRKLKKKLLKKHIKIFFYLTPNNKLYFKSKNSRMGKGKGMFNRVYFRKKYDKPVICFKNLNNNKIIKLKYFINKFVKYKII